MTEWSFAATCLLTSNALHLTLEQCYCYSTFLNSDNWVIYNDSWNQLQTLNLIATAVHCTITLFKVLAFSKIQSDKKGKFDFASM